MPYLCSMSKRIIWILAIALSFAMMGLIVLQIKWIRNAIDLKEIQFQQLVNSTLSDVSRQLEQYYTSSRVNTIIEEKRASSSGIEWHAVVEGSMNPGIKFERKQGENILISPKEGMDREELIEMIGDTILVITHSGEGSRDTIHISQYHDQANIQQLEKSLKEQEILVSTIVKRMLLDDVSFENRVNQEQLEKILRNNFVDHGINMDFEYTVIRDNKSDIYSSENFNKNTDFYYYRTGLLNDEILKENNYLYLYFPGQKALVRGSLGFLGVSTLALTLLMIILFTITLYVIFKQKKLSDVKNDFINNMTHELKTPISTISLASQMLNDESIPDEKKNKGHISRIIQTESKRLGYQVERVLQMAVLDQGHLVLKKERVNMHEIIATVIQNFRLQIESQNGKLYLNDEAEHNFVNGDKVHLMNVITNLLDNAVKYSNGTPDIQVRMYNTEHSFCCSVKDKGIGISKENQKKIFERFFRVSTGNVHDVKGFGLGLSYVKLIVEQHGGSIDLASELNKGTKFDILLPLYNEKQF